MPIGVIIIIVFVFLIISVIKYYLFKRKDFNELIHKKLSRHNYKLVKNSFPGLFKIGPYKTDKIKIEVGVVMINDGTVNYKKTYYRIIDLKTDTNEIKQTWAKINTHWFKETKIEFRPPLEKLK